MRLVAKALACVTLVACGGQSVELLDPRDASLPIETRQWLAATEDGVVAARARRDGAAAELAQLKVWGERTEDEVSEPGLEDAVEVLVEARLELAEAELELAERDVAFAEAKMRLAHAERAVHHDLAVYDLEPLRARVEGLREDVSEARGEVVGLRSGLRDATSDFWATYRNHAEDGGDTRQFWIGDVEPIAIDPNAGQEAEPEDGEGEGESDGDGDDDLEGDDRADDFSDDA
ncbi:MAG: hypothetical protein AAGH15_01795 [Myxococcota bacterium]